MTELDALFNTGRLEAFFEDKPYFLKAVYELQKHIIANDQELAIIELGKIFSEIYVRIPEAEDDFLSNLITNDEKGFMDSFLDDSYSIYNTFNILMEFVFSSKGGIDFLKKEKTDLFVLFNTGRLEVLVAGNAYIIQKLHCFREFFIENDYSKAVMELGKIDMKVENSYKRLIPIVEEITNSFTHKLLKKKKKKKKSTPSIEDSDSDTSSEDSDSDTSSEDSDFDTLF